MLANSLARTDGKRIPRTLFTAFSLDTTIEDNGCPGGFTTGPVPPCGGVAGGIGVFVDYNSTGAFAGNVLIQNNQDVGITAQNGSVIFFAGPAPQITVKDHNLYGIVVYAGSQLFSSVPSLIEGNGANCAHAPTTPCGGIVDARNSTIDLRAGTISGNPGPGIFLQFGAHARLNNITVSNNSGDGIHVQWMSTLDYGSDNTVTGNAGASVSCDVESLVVGDLSGLSKVKCPKIEEPR